MLRETKSIVEKKKLFWIMNLLSHNNTIKCFRVKNKQSGIILKTDTEYQGSRQRVLDKQLSNIIWKLFRRKWNGHSGSGTTVQNAHSAWASSAWGMNDLWISRVHVQRSTVRKPVCTPCYWEQNSSHRPLKEYEDFSYTYHHPHSFLCSMSMSQIPF